jgi:two-component system, chemotaxis family, chemotaxis protein CheY
MSICKEMGVMPKRIVVIDDSNLMRNRISQCLTDAGHEVVGKGKDGSEAVDLYSRLRPDVVTLDITMRGKDGIDAAKEILAFDSNAAIIFFTLLDIPNLTAKISRIKVKGVVRKGDEDELLRVLDSIS